MERKVSRKKDQKKQEAHFDSFFVSTAVTEAINLPLLVEIHHNGFWVTDSNGMHIADRNEKCDRNSIMLTPDCLLYVYKIALRHLLLSFKVIEPNDIDAANLIPHIRVRKDKNDPFSNYNKMEGRKFIVKEETISVKKDFIMIELNEKKDIHFTLIFSKGLGKKCNLLSAFKTVIQLLNVHPEMIEKYQNLDYFGEKHSIYWYENGHYPNNLELPDDYNPIEITENFDHIKTTKAGSII